jgi:DNA-directed RNA polymerase subunit RPC12/RpoP
VYVNVLERTNQQLTEQVSSTGVLVTALGVSVAVVGVLFTVAAIVAALILFRQSRDYRTILDEEIAQYKRVLHATTAERFAEMANKLEQIAAAREDLRAATDDTERKKIEERIAALEKERDKFFNLTPGIYGFQVPGRVSQWSAMNPFNFGWGESWLSPTSVTCSRCGAWFHPPAPGLLTPGTEREVRCPQCGEIKRMTD